MKYRNKPVQFGDEKFRSQREFARYMALVQLQKAGQIAGLVREVPFVLAPAVVIQGRKRPALRYFADFVYSDVATGQIVVEDAKGVRTEGYRIKRHLMKAVHDIDIKEV